MAPYIRSVVLWLCWFVNSIRNIWDMLMVARIVGISVMKKLAILPVVTLMLASCGEVLEAHYSNYQAVEQAGAITRGWVPKWIPHSSRSIREAHNIDTNQLILSFDYTPADFERIEHGCNGISHSQVKAPSINRPWWPEGVPESSLATNRLGYFFCENGQAFMAIEFSKGHAYYWRP